jgi:hypothetical protein
LFFFLVFRLQRQTVGVLAQMNEIAVANRSQRQQAFITDIIPVA